MPVTVKFNKKTFADAAQTLALPPDMASDVQRELAIQQIAVGVARQGQFPQALDILGETHDGDKIGEQRSRAAVEVAAAIRIGGGLRRPGVAEEALSNLWEKAHVSARSISENAQEWKHCVRKIFSYKNPHLEKVVNRAVDRFENHSRLEDTEFGMVVRATKRLLGDLRK